MEQPVERDRKLSKWNSFTLVLIGNMFWVSAILVKSFLFKVKVKTTENVVSAFQVSRLESPLTDQSFHSADKWMQHTQVRLCLMST